MRAAHKAAQNGLRLRGHHPRRQGKVPGLRLCGGEADALHRVRGELAANQHGAGLSVQHEYGMEGHLIRWGQHDLNGLHAA